MVILSQTLSTIIKHEGIRELFLENQDECGKTEGKIKGKKNVQKKILPISLLTCEFPGFPQFVEKATLNKIIVKTPRRWKDFAHFLSIN